MLNNRFSLFSVLGCIFVLLCACHTLAGEPPLKVFILAGQSNMQGHGHIRTMDHLGKDPKYGHLLKKIKGPDGKWITRDDVWIAYPDRKKHGKLTVGYGVRDDKIGPALMFGHIIGDDVKGQVLLIKIAWGGRSLALNFRPPSSGKPAFDLPAKLKERIKKGDLEVGKEYKLMLSQVREVLGNLKNYFPDYKGQGYELAGFVWFQGWNDMINPTYTGEYTKNLANFVRDVRKDLKAPKMPFVIGELGVGGEKNIKEKMTAFRNSQAAVAKIPEFKGNVAFVPTAEYWDVEAHDFLNKNWKRRKWSSPEAQKKFESMGSQPPYHYLGSAKIYSLIGYGMAEAMKEMGK